MIIKKISKTIYRIIVNKIFFTLYGKITYSKNINKIIKIHDLKKKNIKNIYNKNYKIYEIQNGRICSDNVENVAVILNNQIINKVSYQQNNGILKKAKYNVATKRGTPYFLKKYSGKVLSLAQGASGNNNYFHWLFDILPKIKISSEYYNLKKINYFYLSELQNFQKEILSLIGLKKIKIIDSNKFRHIQSNKIIVPEHPWYLKGKILNEVNNMPIWIIKWLRKTFINKGKKTNIGKKIFIDRTESKYGHCQIKNSEEIKNYLTKKGFDVVRVGQLSFGQQISLFKNAKIIVGAHGAAFANLIFCMPNTKIVEIKPINNPNLINKRISKVNKLNYKLISTKIIPKTKRFSGDIFLKINDLQRTLK